MCLATGVVTAAQKKTAPARPPKDAAADINTPAADATHVVFETTEGTWMSVDVSPDGTTLVFDVLGDLYTVPVAGGTATALTRGPAYDYHPRYSPDGKTIAFTSDENGMENLWLVDADGKNRRAITSEKTSYVRSAAWLPGGEYLVARREDAKRAGIPPCELWLFHRRGGSGIKLTSGDDLNNSSGPVGLARRALHLLRRAPDALQLRPEDSRRASGRSSASIGPTGERSTIASGIGGAARPALSPDGATMVYVSRRDADTVLVARTLATGAERLLARGLSRDDQEGFAAMDVWPNYAFMPDGSALIFSSGGHLQRLSLSAGATPAVVPVPIPVDIALAPTVMWQEKVADGAVEARILRSAQQSPDGRWIVFEAFGRCWLQPLQDGKPAGSPRRLTAEGGPEREYTPAFSPDGQYVAFVSWSDAQGGAVWKVRARRPWAPPPRASVSRRCRALHQSRRGLHRVTGSR